MNHTFKNENGHLVATATFGKDEIKNATEKAVKNLCQDITVKGFRKGKAPLEEARKYIRSDDLGNHTINELLKVVDREFFKDPEFNGYNLLNGFRPKVSLDKFSNEEAKFTITYVLRPYTSKIGQYKDIKADAEEKIVDDKAIDERIHELAQQNSELVTKEKAAEKGDVVNIDFTGLLNGEAFDGGSAKGFDLELGSNHFVPGFEDQLIGHKAGDKVDVNVTLPAEYPEPLSGKDVLFKVVINSVKVKEIPEINDDFATTLTGKYVSTNLEDLKNKVKSVLIEEFDREYQRDVINSLLLKIRNDSEFVIPDEYIEQLLDNQIKFNSERLESQGLSLDEYLKILKKDKEDYRNEIKAQLVDQLKTSLLYDAIFANEKLAYPTNKELEEKLGKPLNEVLKDLNSYFKKIGQTEEQIRAQTNSYLNEVNSSIIFEKVQNRLLELNGYKQVEKPLESGEESKKSDSAE